MQLTVNGEPREVPEPQTVRTLLEALGVPVRSLAVEVNGTVLERDRYDHHTLAHGDQVEIVRLVGGG
jgi:thiamine biosynthesis protein ThiS